MEYQPKKEEGEDGGNGSLRPVSVGPLTLPDSPIIHESDYTYPPGHPEQHAASPSLFTHNSAPGPSTCTATHSLQDPQYSSHPSNQYTHTTYGYSPHNPTFALQQNLQNPYSPTAIYPQVASGFSTQAHQQTVFAPQGYSPRRPAFAVQQNLQIPYSPTPSYPQVAPGFSAQAHQQTVFAPQGYSPRHLSLLIQQNVPQYNADTTAHPATHPRCPPNFAHQSIPPYYSGYTAKPEAHTQEPEKRSVKHLTCYYWYTDGHCKWTDDTCAYAHVWTGKVADRPLAFGPGRAAIAGRKLRDHLRIVSGRALESQKTWTRTLSAVEATPGTHLNLMDTLAKLNVDTDMVSQRTATGVLPEARSSPAFRHSIPDRKTAGLKYDEGSPSHKATSPMAISPMATSPMATSPLAISPMATSPMTTPPMATSSTIAFPNISLPSDSSASALSTTIPTAFLFNLQARFLAYEAALKTQASLLRQSTTGFTNANTTLTEQASVIKSAARALDTNSQGQFSDTAIQIFTAAAYMEDVAKEGKEMVGEVEEGEEKVKEGLKDIGAEVEL